ncbi:GNAT family N-acetyltransferase [Arthrobacter sp. ISL-69]|nr:GNAT family N-acetyltransferase [Arthrobacter sp. ISL-69]
MTGAEWNDSVPGDRKNQLREKFDAGTPAPGVLAFRDGQPVGWCAVEPRGCYPRILRSQVLKAAGPAASSQVAAALLQAAVGHALAHGAGVVEGYPVIPEHRPKAGPADLYHGTPKLFLAAGFEEVSHAVPGRAVVRLVAPS